MQRHTVTVEIETQDAAGDWHYPLVDITVSYEPETAGSYEPGGDAPEGAHVEFVSASLPWPDEIVIAMLSVWPEAPAGIYSAGLKRRDISVQIMFADQTGLDALALAYIATHADNIIDQIVGN